MRLVPYLAVLTLAPLAAAQGSPPLIEFVGSPNAVDVAGRAGTVTTIGDADSPYLTDLTFYERSDEPCAVEIDYAWGDDALWDGCEGARRSPLTLAITAPSPQEIAYSTVEIPGRGAGRVLQNDGGLWYDEHGKWALRRLRVCTNGRSGARGELVKGVEAEWSVNPFDAPGDQYTVTRQVRRTNCDADEWSEWSACRGQRAAAQLRLHHKPIGGRRGLVGIQLVCVRTQEI
jgi:hypothetical protein